MDGLARLNITWHGANGDLPDPVPYDATDAALKQMAEESIRGGYIPGIQADQGVDLSDFVVDRFPSTEQVDSNRIFIRPKTPFGG
jgi:hypothetical protein